ncbi:MAG: dihydrodipicolinate synthase family protein [Desulfobacteraceae bacterium]|nr:dihydrodipicolinate synthase family protein [Desulfobacteraceae bacterium]
MATVDLNGIFPPISTPFINGKIAYKKLESNIEKWSKTGLKGFVVLGSNGEYVYLSEQEKRDVVEAVVQSSPADMLIMVGSGCESTEETLRLTEDCAKMGAHAALVITPFYYGGKMTEAALINHYTVVADGSPIPIVLYSVPKFTHLNLTADIVSLLSKHPNIIGIKESSGDVNLLGEFLNNVDEAFHVLVGAAGVLYGALAIGCSGGIVALANVAPENCVKIFELVKETKFERAKELQLRMIPVNKAVTSTYGISGLKAAMDMLGYFGGDPRLPLLPLSEVEKSEIKEILDRAELLQ